MISVVIPARNEELALVRTLATLVPAVAEGVVRDVVVADVGSSDDTRVVADAAGCGIIGVASPETALAEVAGGVRCAWILLIYPGVTLEVGWHDEAAAFVARQAHQGAAAGCGLFRLRREAPGWQARIADALDRLRVRATGRPGPRQPVLLRREAACAGKHAGRGEWLRSRAFVLS
jgi:glycosyltransferase involved in cell wall biosynthesis